MTNQAEALYRNWCENADFTRSYKAPHANRPTPPRPHHSRFSRTIPAIKHP